MENSAQEKEQQWEETRSQFETEKAKLKNDYNDVCLLYHDTFAKMECLHRDKG